MIRISLPYIYELSGTLRLLNGISDGTPIKENLWALVNAENALNGFLSQSVYTTSLRATVLPGHALVQAIKKLTTEPDKERALDFFDSYSLRNSLKEFETVLTAEMNVSDTYFVTKKRGYDTPDLINNAEVLFPQDLLLKVPECRDDIRQAGKCIAFELGTAAGFHIMRANELVLRRYWDVVTNGKERPKTNNMGDYLHEMEHLKVGDEKTICTLRQIKDLHRNELMHPEESLTVDDAIALLGIAQSAIISMLRLIPEAPMALPAGG